MVLQKMSVPEAVREIVGRSRSIYDCMRMDLISYTALAVRIRPEVEQILGGSVNLNTIVVAIKRYADALRNDGTRHGDGIEEDDSALKNARLVLTDGIMDIKFSLRDLGHINPASILDKFSKVTDDYEFFRLTDSFRFLAEDVDGIRQIFSGMSDREGNMFSTGLARIKILLPDGAKNRSDVVSYVADVLHTNGIELDNAFFSQDSITIVLNGGQASRAYEILRSEIVRT